MNNTPEPTATPLLEARDLHKVYHLNSRRLEVLRGISLSVSRGGFLAIRGASGAGKSTLLHLLAGLDHPDQGEVLFDGQRITGMPNAFLSRWRNEKVGFVFQAYHLLPELTALENVCVPARIARRPLAAAAHAARELLTQVGLGERMDHLPSELSGGEQQRVAIARALVNDPAIILADEPTGNLDSQTGGEIIDLLFDLRVRKGLALIIATHDGRVAHRAPQVLHLVDGQILDPGPVIARELED
jgi:predicted ABC-type transport system involved in lysophospholipase L1 biosynthesis ATPase subunit